MTKEEVERLFDELKESSLKALADFETLGLEATDISEKEWAKFWLIKTQQSLLNIKSRMKGLSEHNMLVYDSTVEPRPFWLAIMTTVKKSIRTTNILSVSSFGNILNTDLLLKQKERIERGVQIHRVFIYDPKNHEQVANLISTLSTQLLCNINVYALEESIFKSDSIRKGNEIGAEDFMIIDDKYVYETHYQEDLAAYRNYLTDDENNLNIKNKIWSEMIKRAIPITLDNVNTFNKDIS